MKRKNNCDRLKKKWCKIRTKGIISAKKALDLLGSQLNRFFITRHSWCRGDVRAIAMDRIEHLKGLPRGEFIARQKRERERERERERKRRRESLSLMKKWNQAKGEFARLDLDDYLVQIDQNKCIGWDFVLSESVRCTFNDHII